ncbi:death domain-associated protein 6 [Caerostris darwini]|uniref:Death domain-associated protein 6 n=1 Tax=Caerostris darwini TaxID=1538125 RepID=A0AAV4S5D2_9ARAC|nr:death domain-associated protein 6 [Caerostris darwini]
MEQDSVEVITLISSDEDSPPLVTNSLNINSDVIVKKTARKSTQSANSFTIIPIKQENAPLFKTSMSNSKKFENCTPLTRNKAASKGNMSFVRKSVSNSRVNIKKSNLPVTFTETKKSSSVSSLNGIPSSAKNLPELTIIPIPKSSVSEMTDSLKSVRTARKSLNSQTLRQLPPGIQVIARTDSSKASFHSSVLSDTKKTTKNESQLTKIKGSSSKNVTNFQQKTNVSSDTNKTHVSSSLPQLIPKSSKKMYLEKNLYHGSKTDSEKKKIINSNGRIPASLLTSVDKGEVSIRNISNNDFSSNSEVLMNNEKNDVKYIQTVRGLSITEVGSKKITIATNNVKNKSMTNKPSETSRVINNAKMLNNNLMINRKQRNPSISSSGNLRKQMIISEVPGILINKTSTGRQAKLSINKNDDRNNIKTSNVNNQVDTNSNNSNDIYDIWKSDSSKKRRSKSTKKITPNPVLNTTESKSNKEPNFPVHSVKSTNSKNSTLQNKLNIFEKDVKKFDVQEPADQKQAIKRKSSETLPSNRPMKKPSPEMKSNGMLLQNSLKQRIQAINKSLKEFGSATIQEENKELASVNVTKDVSNISENASVSKPNISENTQTQINEKIEKYGETQLQELNLSPNADQDVSNISENASISKPKISENTQTQINEKIENYSETQLQELNLKSPNADQVAVDVKQKEAPTKKPCKQVTSPKLSLKRKGTNKNTTAKRPKISKNSKIKSVENKESKDILVPKDSLPWSEEDVLHTKYIKFLQFCLPFMKSSKSEEYKIIKRFGKLFKRTESIYLESIDFMNLLLQTVFKAKTDPGNIFLHLQVVSNELKNHKKIDLSGHISSSSDKLEFVKTSVSFTNGEHQSEFSKSKCTDSSISLSKPTEYTEPAASTSQSIALDEPIISTSKSTEPSKSGKSLPCISMESGEPVSSTSSLIKSTEFMASPSRSNVEPSALNEGEISNVYGDAEKKVEPSGNGKSNIIDESVVINVTPNMVKPNIIQNSFKSSITNESVEHSKTSESVEPNVTIPAEPSVTNVSVEPSVTNVFAEPSVANVSAESSVTVEPSKLDKKIRKLQTKELTLDDLDDEESIYIREDQYKRKFNQIWNLLCQYKKRSTLIGRKIEKRFHFEGSRYQSIDEAVERLVNKRKPYEKFPNYKEVLDLVKKKNEAEFLGLTSRDEEDLAADIFKEIGKELQRRRQLDVEEDLASYVPDNVEIEDDPADHDEELKSKLTKSAIDGEKKLNEILQEYVIKQRDEEKIQDDVMEVNETAESDNCDEMEETDPATPSTEERMDDSDDDCKSSKNAKFDQKPSPPKPNNVVSDVIEIGSSSDVSTEPGCELLESRKKEARREERSNLLTEQPVFISDEIEVIEVKNSEHDSSDSLPSLKEFIVI